MSHTSTHSRLFWDTAAGHGDPGEIRNYIVYLEGVIPKLRGTRKEIHLGHLESAKSMLEAAQKGQFTACDYGAERR